MGKTLILGKGYIGSELEGKLPNSLCVSRSMLNYTSESLLSRYIYKNDIDTVINCVGFTGRPNIDEAEIKKEECWNLNVILPFKISNLCKRLEIDYIQISSGCIYDGYEKEWSEEDLPNFGLYNESSFYSKTKHASETLNDYGMNIRIRMPFGDELADRNYLKKILNYKNLIDYKNSKTYICDLSRFLGHVLTNNIGINYVGNLNFVNPDALYTREVIDLMKKFDLSNDQWTFVDIKELNIKAPRSNCVLSIEKLERLFPEFEMKSESEALEAALSNYL